VLNGADGLSEIAAGLVGQGLTILESVKKSLGSTAEASYDEPGTADASPPAASVPPAIG
jgi:flotillin